MSRCDWPGTRLARATLRRIVDGKPAFPRATAHPGVIAARRGALRYLFAEGYIRRGPKPGGPEATDKGRAEFVPGPLGRKCKLAPRELKAIRALYSEVSGPALAARFGCSAQAVRYHAWKAGIRKRRKLLTRKSDRLQELPYP